RPPRSASGRRCGRTRTTRPGAASPNSPRSDTLTRSRRLTVVGTSPSESSFSTGARRDRRLRGRDPRRHDVSASAPSRRHGGMNLSTPASPLLSPSQLATLAEIGEERSAPVGELLYRVGDRTYPFIAILEGEVAIIDAAGNELVRHGPSGFLGELNLLSGQTVFVNARVTEPVRYIAVARSALRSLLNEDGLLGDLLLSTFISRREALQSVEGIGLEIVGPHDSEPTMRMLEFARANRLPYTWEDASPPGGGAAPLLRLPGGGELHGPTAGQVLRALGIGLRSEE